MSTAPKAPLRIDDLRHPAWLEDGMSVWIRFGKGKALRCTVQVAAGDAGRVVGAPHHVDRWLPLRDMLDLDTDVHARPARLPAGL